MEKYYDYIIIGSGFGGSVSALRLSEKGYKVLVIEKGKWYKNPYEDFPKTIWNLKKWMWLPKLGFHGIQNLAFFQHISALTGVGVGGGSLVYANTLPVPKSEFFNSGNWKGLDDWEQVLQPYYAMAKKMLGATTHPYMSLNDKVIKQLAEETGKPEAFSKTDVAVYFGKPGETVPDPYFEGKGPDRTGCILCGGCMVGCRYNSKNTLDKNYLHLAQQSGCEIIAEEEVTDVIPLNPDGSNGYTVKTKSSTQWFKPFQTYQTKGIIFAGGVLGTISLLLRLKASSLPNISDMVGHNIRSNSESLISVTSLDKKINHSEGIAIGSIFNIDEHRHLEPVRYNEGSGFWRVLVMPMVDGKTMVTRIFNLFKQLLLSPIQYLKIFFVDDWAKRTLTLLYMESIDSTLQFKKLPFGLMRTKMEKGKAPSAFNSIAHDLAKRVGRINNGKPMVMVNETLFGIPSTAHILGGACMGAHDKEGVIDKNNKVFNYQNMMVCDGSMISANIGVNPSLSITAITELAMSRIEVKGDNFRTV